MKTALTLGRVPTAPNAGGSSGHASVQYARTPSWTARCANQTPPSGLIRCCVTTTTAPQEGASGHAGVQYAPLNCTRTRKGAKHDG